MVVWHRFIRYDYPRCIKTLGSDKSMAVDRHHVFGGTIIIHALSVGPINDVSVSKKVKFCLVKATSQDAKL